MARKLIFPQLKSEKGWPYCRQHTHRLVQAKQFPAPEKLYPGGLVNVWDEDVVDAFMNKITDKTDEGRINRIYLRLRRSAETNKRAVPELRRLPVEKAAPGSVEGIQKTLERTAERLTTSVAPVHIHVNRNGQAT